MCGSPVEKNCACGAKTFSCSVTDRTTATRVGRKLPEKQLLNKASRVDGSDFTSATPTCCCVFVFAGITLLLELPKNCIAAAMDKEIGKQNTSDDQNACDNTLVLKPFFFSFFK